MTNPTTPQPVQEPAGAVEALKLVEKIKQHADECADQAWHAGECNERVGTPYFESLRLFNQALDQLAALASLPPVTQAKSEAVAPIGWQFRFVFDTHASNWHSVLRLPMNKMQDGDDYRYETRYVYAAPQEAVERQPLTGWQPIETAPRNSRRVLVAVPERPDDPDRRRVYEAWWRIPFEGAPKKRGWWCYDGKCTLLDSSVHGIGATQWIEVPTPPGIGPATQEKQHG